MCVNILCEQALIGNAFIQKQISVIDLPFFFFFFLKDTSDAAIHLQNRNIIR